MRKLLPFLLLIPSLAGATYIPGPIQVNNPAGTPTGIGWGATVSSVPVAIQNTSIAISTGGVTAAQGGTWTVQPGNTPNTTDWRVTMATNNVVINQPTVLGATVTYNGTQQVNVGVLYQPTVIGATVTYNGTQGVSIIQPTVLGATITFNGTQNVQLQAGSALAGQVVINEPNVLGATVTFNGTQNVQLQTGANIIGEVNNNGTIGFTVTPGTGTWSISQPDAINVVSTQTLANQGSAGVTDWPVRVSTVSVMVLISSATTMPAVHVDASSAPIMADQLGRIVTVAGAPTSVYQTTAPTTTSIGFMVLVASPASTVFTHVCGCIFNNSSATGVTAVIYPTGGVVNPHVTIQLPATDSRGIWPGCDEPFLNTVGGVQVSAKISASVSTVDGYCVFYQTNAP